MTQPVHSVVVPAYNSAGTIGETIASILAQTIEDLELVIVDDGSSDSTPSVIEGWAERDDRIRVVHRENGGTAAARNTGIAEAQAPFVSFLDDDDLWFPDYLESVRDSLEAAPEAGFAHVDAYILDDGLKRIHARTSFAHYGSIPDTLEPSDLLRRLVRRNFVMSSATVRAPVLEEVGGFDARLRGTDDWDLWLRIAGAGYGATHPNHPVLLQRDRPGSQSKDEGLMVSNSVATLQKLLREEKLDPETEAAARAQIEAGRTRLDQIRRNAPIQRARRIRRRYMAARMRWLPGDTWLTEPPDRVRSAFPEVARAYGRAARSAS